MRELKFGIEIEFFGAKVQEVIDSLREEGIKVADYEGYTHRVIPQWKVTTDSSVTSNGTGVGRGLELVSPILYGDNGLDELERVYKVLNSIGARVNKTCGTHVHFDIADFKVHDVKNIVVLYNGYQNLINYFLPMSRRQTNSGFCKKIPTNTLNRIYSQCTTIEQISREINTRYVVTNLESYIRYGTIEFRQHSGTLDFNKMESWIVMLYQLLDLAKETEELVEPFDVQPTDFQLEDFIELLGLDNTYIGEFLTNRFNKFREAM